METLDATGKYGYKEKLESVRLPIRIYLKTIQYIFSADLCLPQIEHGHSFGHFQEPTLRNSKLCQRERNWQFTIIFNQGLYERYTQ